MIGQIFGKLVQRAHENLDDLGLIIFKVCIYFFSYKFKNVHRQQNWLHKPLLPMTLKDLLETIAQVYITGWFKIMATYLQQWHNIEPILALPL